MKALLSLLLITLFSSCGIFKTVDDTTYLKALETAKKGKDLEAKPLFIQSCKQGLVAACAAAGESVNREDLDGVAVLQGATTDTMTQINVVVKKDENIRLLIWDKGKIVSTTEMKEETRDFSDWRVLKLAITGLETNKQYRLDVIGNKSELLDTRNFKTLKTKGKDLNFLIVSCMSDSFMKEQEQMWSEALEQTPEVIFIIGDAVYADWVNNKPVREGANPQQLWMRFRQGWNSYKLMKTPNLVPVYGVWDDHDYGKNNGGADFKYKKEAAENYQAFFAQDFITPKMKNFSKGLGVGFSLKLRNQMFYFLDNRSFRSAFEDKEGTHLGEKQEKWLYKNLRKNKMPSYLIMGDQFFGGYMRYESYEGLHKKSLDALLKIIKKIGRKVVFVSGDRHLTEIMKLEPALVGYTTYELTSSGIHSKVYPGSFEREPSPRQVSGADGKLNYMAVMSKAVSSRKLKMKVESFTKGKELLFSNQLEVK